MTVLWECDVCERQERTPFTKLPEGWSIHTKAKHGQVVAMRHECSECNGRAERAKKRKRGKR